MKQKISLIPNTIKKLRSGSDVLIEVVGDSITLGLGVTVEQTYTAQFARSVALLFPNSTVIRYDGKSIATSDLDPIDTYTPFTIQTGTNGQTIRIVRSGIGGNTVIKLFRRIDDFTTKFENALPDLVTVCIGVNDSIESSGTRYSPPDRFESQLDALVRQIQLRTNAEIALATQPYTTNPSIVNYANAVKTVAITNNLQLIDFHKLFADHYDVSLGNYGQGSWMTPTDAYHPTAEAHTVLGIEMCNELFKNNQTIIPVVNTKKIYDYTNNSMFKYVGTWSELTIDYKNDGKSIFKEKYSTTLGNTITFDFTGTDISILTRRSRDGGKFSYSIDGAAPVVIDLITIYPTDISDVNNDNTWASCSAEKIVIGKNLPNKLHTVVLTVERTPLVFFGVEIESKNNLEINEKIDPVTNRGLVNITGTGTSYASLTVTFPNKHKNNPIVVVSTDQIDYIACVSSSTTTTTTIFLSRKDGTVFSETKKINYISMDA